ncbi:MAG: 2Fe-2S iron-sulfur cluster-binding protein [Chloroflexota bacterium]
MPQLTIQNKGTFDASDGKKLVLAIEENGSDIMHRCGGNAKCTSCRVEFIEGEPEQMTVAERDKLQEQDNMGAFRLSCQILVNQDMTVNPLMTVSGMGMDDAGPTPADDITPEPEWTDLPE